MRFSVQRGRAGSVDMATVMANADYTHKQVHIPLNAPELLFIYPKNA